MGSDDRPAQGDQALIHDSRPHKVQPRLVLQTPRKKYRRTEVGGLADLVGVVNESASMNVAQQTLLEDGTVLVTTYDWQDLLH